MAEEKDNKHFPIAPTLLLSVVLSTMLVNMTEGHYLAIGLNCITVPLGSLASVAYLGGAWVHFVSSFSEKYDASTEMAHARNNAVMALIGTGLVFNAIIVSINSF